MVPIPQGRPYKTDQQRSNGALEVMKRRRNWPSMIGELAMSPVELKATSGVVLDENVAGSSDGLVVIVE